MTKRRDFIKKSILGTAGITIGGMGFSARSYDSVVGSNDRLILAVIGIRGQGGSHIESWCELTENRNIRLKTLCDVDEQYYRREVKNCT